MTVIGADEPVVRVNGGKTVIGVVADAATGEVLGLDALVEPDSDGFMERLGDFVSGCSFSLWLTAKDEAPYSGFVKTHRGAAQPRLGDSRRPDNSHPRGAARVPILL